ncbi:MAG: phosphopantetheine-binding protein [Acidobacteriota bacterium]
MDSTDRIARLRTLVQQVSEKPAPDDVDESLFESGLLDSFALPDLIAAIEESFSIKVPDTDLSPRKFDSLSRIAQYLEQRGS